MLLALLLLLPLALLAADSEQDVAAPPPIDPRISKETLDADQATEQLLRARLARIASLANVRTEVAAGVARLSGEVLSEDDRSLAERISKQTSGVIDVVNGIELSTDLRPRFSLAIEQLRYKLGRLILALPLLLVSVALVAAAAYGGTWLAERAKLLRLRSRNPFISTLIRHAIQAVILLAGILVALDIMGATALAGAVIGTAGVAGLALGFAFRDIIENYISSILLSLRQPFSPGDHVVIDRHEGKVAGLSARATALMTLDGNHLRLPNSLVFKSVILNYTRNPLRRFTLDIAIAEDQDLRRSLHMSLETLRATPGVLSEPPPSAGVVELKDSAALLRLTAWVDQREHGFGRVRSEALIRIHELLEEACISTPVTTYRVDLQKGQASAEPAVCRIDLAELPEETTTPPGDDVDAQVDRETATRGNLLNASAPRE